MGQGRAPESYVENGVSAREGEAGPFLIGELEFPSGYRQPWFEPEHPYVGVVLAGALEKQFARTSWTLETGTVFTIPPGASHSARFSRTGARVALVWIDSAAALPGLPRRFFKLRHHRHEGAAAIGRRLSAELALGDWAWSLAAEGLALELLALVARTDRHTPGREHPPAWLATAEELLDPDSPEHPTLAGLAAEVGVHPAHMARVFRKHHGMSVGEYARMLRIEWAARRLAGSDTPIGLVALEAGFCDQSHFTRAFKSHTGLTPARYRQTTRPD